MSGLLGTLLSPLSVFEDWFKKLEARWLAVRAPGLRGAALRIGQIFLLARRRCLSDHVGDRAAALAFSTLLSILPLLLLSLATLEWWGVPAATLSNVESWLFATFVPDVAESLIQLLRDSAATLSAASKSFGTAGFLLLFLAGSNLLSTLSRAFTRIWGEVGFFPTVGRILGFWTLVIGGPVLIAFSLYLTAATERFSDAANLLDVAISLLGFAVVALAAYLVLPGRRARIAPAAFGALVAGLLFDLLKRGFAAYVRGAFVASTLLAGLGMVPIFLLWLWFVWVAFLFGAECAWCAQEFDAAIARVRGPVPPRAEPEPGSSST